MKTLAIVLAVMVLALGGVLGYALFNTALSVEGHGLEVLRASDRPDEFRTLQQKVELGTLEGALFTDEVPINADEYRFYIYTLRLRNKCLVPAQMVEIQLAPGSQDVLYYDEEAQVDIQPGESRDVWCVLLTKGEPSPVRDLTVTYYLWGNAQGVKHTYE